MLRSHGGLPAIVAVVIASLSGACGGRPVPAARGQAGADSAAAAAVQDAGVADAASPASAPDGAAPDVSTLPDAADASGEASMPAQLSLSPGRLSVESYVGSACPVKPA